MENVVKNFNLIKQEIVDKKKIKSINLKNNDKIEIVHFIGGG